MIFCEIFVQCYAVWQKIKTGFLLLQQAFLSMRLVCIKKYKDYANFCLTLVCKWGSICLVDETTANLKNTKTKK